ncbi:MAG: GTPase ObgE [Bacteroidetes bacterium]|nr:MAG: GTPase ObgE [Bacteroidota bacterium]
MSCGFGIKQYIFKKNQKMNQNFIDHVRIYCFSGKGGAGSVHFRREKFAPLGGPDGGNGGRGGHIILKGNAQRWTLLHLRYQKHIKATDGQAGAGARCSGSQGIDRMVEVPIGTIAKVYYKRKEIKAAPVNEDGFRYDEETLFLLAQEEGVFLEQAPLPDEEEEIDIEAGINMADYESEPEIFEILEDGQEVIAVPGGRGGLGNHHFKSATNQAPQYAQPGEPLREALIILELKLLADVGLVGFPNAGKSTLLSVVSAAKPEIADYPFTTLVPNLGVVSYRDYQSFVMADIPGLIEGAAEGRGLGTRFLRHIERNAMLLFMVSAESDDINHDYRVLLHELEKYNPELLDKQRLLAITKSDLIDEELKELIGAEIKVDCPFLFISSATQQGITELKDWIMRKLKAE